MYCNVRNRNNFYGGILKNPKFLMNWKSPEHVGQSFGGPGLLPHMPLALDFTVSNIEVWKDTEKNIQT